MEKSPEECRNVVRSKSFSQDPGASCAGRNCPGLFRPGTGKSDEGSAVSGGKIPLHAERIR